MHLEIIGQISSVETIAAGRGIRTLTQIRERYGAGRWRKLEGVATVRLAPRGIWAVLRDVQVVTLTRRVSEGLLLSLAYASG